MAKPPSKQVDLVIYKGGERIVVGKASMAPDGSIYAQVAKDVRADIKDLVMGDVGDISINPKVAVDLKYNQIMSTVMGDDADFPSVSELLQQRPSS